MTKNKSRLLKFLGIAIILLLIAAFFIYRAKTPSLDLKERIDIPELTKENVIDFTEAPDHVNESYWVRGVLDHVFVSGNNNYFLNANKEEAEQIQEENKGLTDFQKYTFSKNRINFNINKE